jgi:apolipoprotein N-acyltransferase
MKSITPRTLAIISGLLYAASLPPFDISILAWFAWVPLLMALHRNGWQNGFRLGFTSGLALTTVSLSWIANNSGTIFIVALSSMVVSVLYLSLFFGLFALIISRGGEKFGTKIAYAIPFIYVSIEYFYGYHGNELGFPWLTMALSQNLFPQIQQLASMGGISMVTFWIMSINSAIFLLETGNFNPQYHKRNYAILALLILFTFFWGHRRITYIDNLGLEKFPFGIIQTNLSPKDKWERGSKSKQVRYLLQESQKLVNDGAKIIVWPESAVPAHLAYYAQFDTWLQHFCDTNDASIITGALHHERTETELYSYNSAFFYSPYSELEIYSKQRLVPFGERIPLVSFFPALKILNFGQANFEPGDTSLVVEIGTMDNRLVVGTTICYESAEPYYFGQFVDNGAEVMTIVTNDGWLGTSLGPYQHFALAKLRAIEQGKSIIRSAQTGISALIRPNGIVDKYVPLNQQGSIMVQAPIGFEKTIYANYDDWFALFVLVVSSIIILSIFFSIPKKKNVQLLALSMIILFFQETTFAEESCESQMDSIRPQKEIVFDMPEAKIISELYRITSIKNASPQSRTILTLSLITFGSVVILFWARSRN